ncbi:MAG TPA: cupin [Burkholderiaceae bacterium]|nr:cupin [Burkholderiaceae bacterium]
MNTPRLVRAAEFRAAHAWDALELARVDGVTARLHWTDRPYRWHVNDGTEVFAVLDGLVDMHYRVGGADRLVTLGAGDIFVACEGCEHIARPRGEARVLVVERAGSP